jgi:hypothetical protein
MILTYIFLFVWTVAYCKEAYGFQEKNIFNQTKVVLDHQPIMNNTLIYAACSAETDESTMICTVILESFPMSTEIYKKACEIKYQASKDTVINKDYIQLKLLYDKSVIFMWSEKLFSNNDLSLSVHNLIYRVIDMSSCKIVETRIPYDVSPLLRTDIDDFYVVAYANTFDVFFSNNSLCGNKMCGQTHDLNGNLINGPVASYLPVKFFRKPVFVYPAKSRSPFMGHFLLSSKFYLVSTYYGKITELMDYPFGIDALAFSCENGFLGGYKYSLVFQFGSLSELQKSVVN